MYKNKIFIFLVLILFFEISNAKEENLSVTYEVAKVGDWEITLVRDAKAAEELDIDRRGGTLGIYEINGSPLFFGAIVISPKSVITSLTVKNKEKSYELDVSDMYSRVLKPRPNPENFYRIWCEDICIVRANFLDDASSFVVEWQIKDGVAERTIIADMRHPYIYAELLKSFE